MSEKLKCLVFPPECGDGQHTTVIPLEDLTPQMLEDLFCTYNEWGDDVTNVTIHFCLMTREEVEALPDV